MSEKNTTDYSAFDLDQSFVGKKASVEEDDSTDQQGVVTPFKAPSFEDTGVGSTDTERQDEIADSVAYSTGVATADEVKAAKAKELEAKRLKEEELKKRRQAMEAEALAHEQAEKIRRSQKWQVNLYLEQRWRDFFDDFRERNGEIKNNAIVVLALKEFAQKYDYDVD